MELRDAFAFGWPTLALWCLHENLGASVAGGIVTPLPAWNGGQFTYKRTLPYRIILPGFIINTLFYALLLWLLLFTPFAARRMLRRRRGQCEQCAYPIGVSPVCTECGAAIPRKVEA